MSHRAVRSFVEGRVRGVQVNDVPARGFASQDEGAPAEVLAAEVKGYDRRVAPFLDEDVVGLEGQARRSRGPDARDGCGEGFTDLPLAVQPRAVVFAGEESRRFRSDAGDHR